MIVIRVMVIVWLVCILQWWGETDWGWRYLLWGKFNVWLATTSCGCRCTTPSFGSITTRPRGKLKPVGSPVMPIMKKIGLSNSSFRKSGKVTTTFPHHFSGRSRWVRANKHPLMTVGSEDKTTIFISDNAHPSARMIWSNLNDFNKIGSAQLRMWNEASLSFSWARECTTWVS